MKDMQRWEPGVYDSEPPMMQSDDGPYVLAADAEAAIAATRQDMLAKCIAAVEAWALENPHEHPSPNRIITALRALEERP